MTDSSPGIRKSDSQFSDERVRRFLLGGLSAAEQTRFEERLFADEGLETRVRLAECELADDYAFERLSAAERELFEQYYLVSAHRKRTLLVSGALRDRFSGVQTQPQTIGERLRARFIFRRPVLRFAFGLVILILLIGTAWLVTKEPRLVKIILPKRAPAAPSPSAPREASHPSNPTSTPTHRENFPETPPHESLAPGTVASFVLTPNRREAANIPAVNVPKGERDVMRFQLSLQPNPYGTFRAEVVTDDGRLIYSAEALNADGSSATVAFDVPARLLKSGNYEIRLTDGAKLGGGYYFLVQ